MNAIRSGERRAHSSIRSKIHEAGSASLRPGPDISVRTVTRLGYSIQEDPFQNHRLMRPAGETEIAAHPPEPPIRLSLKYLINALFVHVPPEYAQGSPRELKEGSVVRGSDKRPRAVFVTTGGASSPAGI